MIPITDMELRAYGANFKERTTATPLVFAMTAPQAASFGAKFDAYDSALQAVIDARASGVVSKSLTSAKNSAKKALLDEGRQLYAMIQFSSAVSDANKDLVSVKIRKTTRTPVNPPPDAPTVIVERVYGHQVRVRIKDAASPKNRKAPGADGAALFTFYGPNPPGPTDTWKGEGNVTKGEIIVLFPNTLPAGTKIWFCAFWYTRAGLSSPTSTPIWSVIGHEGAEPLAS